MRSQTRRARLLRRRSTLAEHRVWRWLRHRYLSGFKFRRQHPVGRYFLDFYCPELKLAIELDGRGHDEPAQRRYDVERSAELADDGIECMRLRNEVVLEQPDAAWEMIVMAVERAINAALAQHSPLSPRERGEG